MSKKNMLLIAMILVFSAIFAACGNEAKETDKEESADAETSEQDASKNEEANAKDGEISVTDLEGNTVELAQVPERIIPFSTGDLEVIYELGGEVVGKPTIAGEVPEYLQDVPDIGTTVEVNMEKIASLDPDLVIAHPQLNAKDLPALKELGMDVLQTGATSIDEVESSIEMIGKVLQKEKEAEELIGKIDSKIAGLKDNMTSELRALIVFGVPGNWMVALPNSLSGSMLEAVGGYNIAKDYPKLEKFPQYAQVNIEKIVEANPEVIFLITPGSSDGAKESFSKEMEKNPAWESIHAVQNGNFVYLPNHLFGSNPGSKIIESLDYLQKEIEAIEEK